MDRSRFPLRLSQWTRRFLVKGAVWREEDRTPSSSSLVLSLEPALSRVSDWRGSWGGGGGAHRSAPSHKDSRGNVSGLLAGETSRDPRRQRLWETRISASWRKPTRPRAPAREERGEGCFGSGAQPTAGPSFSRE